MAYEQSELPERALFFMPCIESMQFFCRFSVHTEVLAFIYPDTDRRLRLRPVQVFPRRFEALGFRGNPARQGYP